MNTFKSPRIYRFIEECAKPGVKSAVEAARNAGYSENGISETASRLLANPSILEAIHTRRTELAANVELSIEMVLRRWLDIATADPSKIIRVRHLNCRHCWGVGYAYQWSAREYAEKAAHAMDLGETPPDCQGGFGWRFNADPNPECPECHGEGIRDVFIADTSTLTGPERALYAGVKTTKDGIEVKMHDQMAALDNIRDYLGMIVKRSEITGKDGRPLYPGGKLPVVEELPSDPKLLEIAYRDITGT